MLRVLLLLTLLATAAAAATKTRPKRAIHSAGFRSCPFFQKSVTLLTNACGAAGYDAAANNCKFEKHEYGTSDEYSKALPGMQAPFKATGTSSPFVWQCLVGADGKESSCAVIGGESETEAYLAKTYGAEFGSGAAAAALSAAAALAFALAFALGVLL